MEGNLLAILLEGNLPFLLCFTFVFEGNFEGGGGGGGLYLEQVCGAYIWRGLFSEFYGTLK